jgi:lysozyme
MTTLGIDVSHYQGRVNWPLVAGSGVKFAFAKATEGTTWVDVEFSRNWAGMQEVGLFRSAYHFARPGQDPESQVAHFAAVVGPLGFRDLPPVLDLEVNDGHPKAAVLEWAKAFLRKGRELFGRRLIIYTGGFWRDKLANDKDLFFVEHDLWLAAYNTSPQLVGGWTKYAFWQYTEGRLNSPADIRGVPPCDQDRFQGSEQDLEALCQGVSPAPKPAPDPAADQAWPGIHFVWPRMPAVAGGAVRHWQARLKELGFDVDVDGVFGPQSKAACIAFQRSHGLTADGIVGKLTWTASFEASL